MHQSCTAHIELRGVSRFYEVGSQRLQVLAELDLRIEASEMVAILGPSGSGKSTLLGLMAGLDRPSSGEVHIDGERVDGLSEDRLALLRRAKVGFVFQSFRLLATHTALENVLLPLELAGIAGARERAATLLNRVGLSGRIQHYPSQLSGGEQQRVALARAFAANPPILLADEPTGNLDSATGKQVLELIDELRRERGTTMVLVTHDPAVAERCDRTVELADGRIVADSKRSAGSLPACGQDGRNS